MNSAIRVSGANFEEEKKEENGKVFLELLI